MMQGLATKKLMERGAVCAKHEGIDRFFWVMYKRPHRTGEQRRFPLA